MGKVNFEEKVRVWVTSDKERTFTTLTGTKSRTLVFHVKKKNFLRLFDYLQREHSIWTMIHVYLKDDSKTILKKYYNFDKCKIYPKSTDEF